MLRFPTTVWADDPGGSTLHRAPQRVVLGRRCSCVSLGVGIPDGPVVLVAPLVGLGIAAEALVVSRQDTSASFSVAAHVAAAILFGPLVAAVVAAIGVLLVDGLRLGPRPSVWLNSAIFGLSAASGGIAFVMAGGSVGSMTARDIGPAVILIAVRFIANEALLAMAISLDTGTGMLRQLRDDVRQFAGAAIGEGSLGVLVASGYTPQHWVLLPFLVPLLAALYVAQLNFERLKRETAAALNAFAGVIDERDPNTASHSQRVAQYVERFTTAIRLPDREAARLIQAARYHDRQSDRRRVDAVAARPPQRGGAAQIGATPRSRRGCSRRSISRRRWRCTPSCTTSGMTVAGTTQYRSARFQLRPMS